MIELPEQAVLLCSQYCADQQRRQEGAPFAGSRQLQQQPDAATEDKDAAAKVDINAVAITMDKAGRVTGAVWDEAEPQLTVGTDGMVDAPDEVLSKLELGDDYGMRDASALGKEWYEHSEGFCDYLKGKTAEQIEAIPTDGSAADLKSLCTIGIEDVQKALLKALESQADA